jgi:uroporphyrinogen-III decarboxylase
MSEIAEELYMEREKRVEDALQLRKPDRVPFLPVFSFFPAAYSGISFEDAMYDYDKLAEATRRVVVDFEPDMYMNPFALLAVGPLLENLDFKQLQWPGHGVAPNHTYQFVENEYMKADEYDDFLYDPTGYILRTHLPRICGALKPLEALPSITGLCYIRVATATAVLGKPELAGAIKTLLTTGAEADKMRSRSIEFNKEMAALGFPSQFGAISYAPFDYIGDFFRGTKGILLDMYRQPDKVIAITEKVLPALVKNAVTAAEQTGNKRIFMPLHKGAYGFMSLPQFEKFYWPTLRQLFLDLIAKGLTPCPLFESDYTDRLKIISDVPEGKIIYAFESTDMFKAKEVLRDKVCIRGNVPAALLCTGSAQDVADYCKKLIDVVGEDGGFILDGGTGIPDETPPDNLRAMAEVIREHGVYY